MRIVVLLSIIWKVVMGKGSAPRPIPDKKRYEDNFDAIFRKDKPKDKPKSKAQLMREMRARRAEQGLKEMRIWVTEEECVKINAILNK
jgi:hypothetical protein